MPGITGRHRLPWYRHIVVAGVAAGALLWSGNLRAQWSNTPDDLTPGLAYTLTPAGDPIAPAFPVPCAATGQNGPFSFGQAISSTPASPWIPPALCGHAPQQPQGPVEAPPKDLWFRLDPQVGQNGSERDFRITLMISGTASSDGPIAGLALYEGASATGALRLLDCATDGGYPGNGGPSVEATCRTPGTKLYIRAWSYQDDAAEFSLCVLNRARGAFTGADGERHAAETPCDAPLLEPGTDWNSIHYAFSCREADFPLPGDDAAGGDLWVKLQVPANGSVALKAAYGADAGGAVAGATGMGAGKADGHVGITAYLSADCNAADRFVEVGSSKRLVPASGTFSLPNLAVTCLPPGALLYVRIHAERGSVQRKMRFGTVQLAWMPKSVPVPATGNVYPCTAEDLDVGTICQGQVEGDNIGHCAYPGVPVPACGGFDGTTASAWYRFTAPANGLVQIDAAPGSWPAMDRPAMALYATGVGATDPMQGCEQRMVLMACDDRQGEGMDARIIQGGLVPGHIYYVRVWSTGAEGRFELCVSSPEPPDGHCWYLVDFWARALNNPYGNTLPSMDVTYPYPGGTTTNFPTHGEDYSEAFLVAVPATDSVHFHFNGGGAGTMFWAIWEPGGGEPLLWWATNGAIGCPSPVPVFDVTLPGGCRARDQFGSDCVGMQVRCLSGAEIDAGPVIGPTGEPYYTDTIDVMKSPYPSAYDSGGIINTYGGATYHPQSGSHADLTGANMGCLEGEEKGVDWFVVQPTADGVLAFSIEGVAWPHLYSQTRIPIDVDFAIWDLGPWQGQLPPDPYDPASTALCPPATAPVRCSTAGGAGPTGLARHMTTESEGLNGWGWLKPLDVVEGHAYLLAILPAEDQTWMSYYFNWTILENASGEHDPGLLRCPDYLAFIGQGPEMVDQAGLRAWPNPARDRLLVAGKPVANGQVRCRVLDAVGRTVLHQAQCMRNGADELEVDLGRLHPGTYLVRLEDGNGAPLGTVRFVKQ